MHSIRQWAVLASKVFLAGFLVLIVVLQCRDFKAATEVFPAAGFAVFLAFASFAISWARVNPPNSTLAELRRVKRAGLDMLIATALMLVSAGLLQCAQDKLIRDTSFASFILVIHLLALAVGLLIGWLSMSTLLTQAVHPAADPPVDLQA